MIDYLEHLDQAHRGGYSDGRARNERTWRVSGITHPFEALQDPKRPWKQGTPDLSFGSLLADERNARWQIVRDAVDTWDITIPYEQSGLGSGIPSDPTNPRNVEVATSFELEEREGYRYEPFVTFPDGGNIPDGTIAVCDGVRVDSGLQHPRPWIVPIAIIRITGDAEFVDEQQIFSTMGRRNDSPWRGYPAGAVLFAGATTEGRVLGVQRVTLNFLADFFFHLEQRVVIRQEGIPPMIAEDPGTASYNVEQVRWVQKYPQLINFSATFGFDQNVGGSLGGSAG